MYRIRVAARGMRISRRKGGERRGRKEEGVATKKATGTAHAHATCPPLYECTAANATTPPSHVRTYVRAATVHSYGP